MARATRAPSQNSYRGALGRTQTETVHVTGVRGELIAAVVHTTIDAVSDPELAERLVSDDPARMLNLVQVEGGEPIRVAVPVVYHDPAAEVLVLVLAEAHRHRELDERIALYQRLRADPSPIPTYVKEFAVVFGGAGLRAQLEDRARNEAEHARLEREVARKEAEYARREQDHARREQELARQEQELERMRAEARARVLAAVKTPPEPTKISPPSAPERTDRAERQDREEREDLSTTQVERQQLDEAEEIATVMLPSLAPVAPAEPSTPALPRRADAAFEADAPSASPSPSPSPAKNGTGKRPMSEPAAVDFEDMTRESAQQQASDPLTTVTDELPVPSSDSWLEFAATGTTSSFRVTDGPDPMVRLALVAGDQIARGLGDTLDARVLLHRAPTYPVVVLVIGPPAALRAPSSTQLAVIPLDIGAELDRHVLGQLGKTFELLVDIIVRGRPIRRVRLTAPLAENVAFIVRAADDHLRGLSADGEAEPSFVRGRDLVLGAGYDLLGIQHAEHGEFRDDKLTQVQSAQHVRRAIAIARRFTRPSREDYLVAARGFPLERWRAQRRRVLEAAVAWGLWMGPELAQIAVSEGLARSRRDLIVKLEAGFEALRQHPTAFDINSDVADDNLKALAEEARALGVEVRRSAAKPANGAIKSEDVPMVSGSIERTPTQAIPRARSVEEMIALLDDKKHRVTVAAELCDRGEGRAAAAVVGAVKKMSRAEAVRILGKSVKFGAAAAPPLIEGLGSSKAFLRHGCALALALLRTDEGTHAVIQLLVDEPTEIWREIARAIGQVGPTALMPLASHVGRIGDRLPQLSERIAWAMAHIGVRGGKAALEQMAGGQSIMAPLAKQALVLLDNAARDEVRVNPGQPSRDVTVNRAFSRRFFEALEPDRPDLAQPALHDLDASGPQELDEADLIVEEEEEAELDESDLIHS